MSNEFLIMCIREAAEELGYCDMKVDMKVEQLLYSWFFKPVSGKVSATIACY